MNGLADVKRGDIIVIHTVQGTAIEREVDAAGPVWVTAWGTKFRREDGRTSSGVVEPHAETVHQHAEHTEREDLTRKLRPRGISPANAYGDRLTLKRLRALAWLTQRWENGEDLPEHLQGTAFARSGCSQVAGEDVIAARFRGSAAECAQDAMMLLCDGNVDEAARLLESAAYYVGRYRGQL